MEIVYLETSFISLLVANPSRDLVTAANQQSTRDWWRLRRGEFVCVASSEVVREASHADKYHRNAAGVIEGWGRKWLP